MAQDSTAHHHDSNSKRIWSVFIILSIVTIVEVILGILKPEFLVDNNLVNMSLLNWIFIVLTLYKAYYIAWSFMHLEQEAKWLRRVIVWTALFLVIYLIFILLNEGFYIYQVYKEGYVAWDF
ncbi:cytochrome C oxidase subunit IV family protein [Autumnicola musiva]|uniref:Cytochrome C oxidase subunit IV family protein n=1 Tax=Autumnicola musiva TaxID=3075589 RepID=A0ABU3D0L2_9FLAO|nr:cytochrome C oxidase subunit IV family protein [Zunongwangia sp. F117]MDT0675053.1 cytochrome C oxidase subunit IV family protein [Zunongwangia sp. F117]